MLMFLMALPQTRPVIGVRPQHGPEGKSCPGGGSLQVKVSAPHQCSLASPGSSCGNAPTMSLFHEGGRNKRPDLPEILDAQLGLNMLKLGGVNTVLGLAN